ncbi:MAG: hypothetical protein WD045_14435 [Pirellulaceae bacterium]
MKTTLWTWTILSLTAATSLGCHALDGKPVGGHNLPPAQMLRHPGPGVDGPGPGVLHPPRIQQASANMPIGPGGPMPGMPGAMASSQILFVSPEGMQLAWDVGGVGMYDSTPKVVPFSKNFPQGGIYRLKLMNIEGQPGVELYPTLEVGPATPRTEAFLAHNAIPIQFTEDDFAQVRSGNFVTKVIYLPYPNYQELALAGVETLVSTRLDPGVDPIVEADRRGTIMAILRVGNKDLEVPGDEYGDEGMMQGGMMPYAGMGHPQAPMMPFVAGMTVPQYGMPQTGTPIGLPGPPHIPLGGPAGLQKHVIKNHTHTHIPNPTSKVVLNVKQRPGVSYPAPPNRAWVVEENNHHVPNARQPHADKHQYIGNQGGAGGEYCPPELR